MPNKITYLEELVTQVKEEEDVPKSVAKLANIMLVMDSEHGKRFTEMNDSITKLSKAIMGNGSPQNSILTRLSNIEKWQKWLFGGFGTTFLGVVGWGVIELIKTI